MTVTVLMVAEKPSLALAIADVLSDHQVRYYKNPRRVELRPVAFRWCILLLGRSTTRSSNRVAEKGLSL